MSQISRFFATFCYIGFIPFAPGTWASLAALIIWQLWVPVSVPVQLILIAGALIIGQITSEKTSRDMGRKDPGEIVIDEVAGMWLALFLLPKTIWFLAAAFCLFRILDIFKPLVIGKVQSLHGGLGIMLDDILAGIFARIILLFFEVLL